MGRLKDRSLTVVLGAAIAIAAFGVAAFVAYGMSTNAHQSTGDGYYTTPSKIAVQLAVGSFAVIACLITCRLGVRRAAGLTSSTVPAAVGAAISVALTVFWVLALLIQTSS
jgi:type IV secretory pathway protease TraF